MYHFIFLLLFIHFSTFIYTFLSVTKNPKTIIPNALLK